MTVPGNLSSPLLATAAAADTGANITKSVRFDDASSTSLDRTPSSSGNRKTWTFSCWFKKSSSYSDGGYQSIFSAGDSSSTTIMKIEFDSVDTLRLGDFTSGGATIEVDGHVSRDYSGWTHLVVKYDTTQSTASDRVVIYFNGVDVTKKSATFPAQNRDSSFNHTLVHVIGASTSSYTSVFDGYIADVYMIDGQALEPTSFAAYDANGVWQASSFSGSFGTNGFHLFDFANESTVGHDSSGNNNDFTANNISTSAGAGNDVLFDVPTNGTQSDTGAGGEVSGNYCTWNPLDSQLNFASLANGNLEHTGSSSGSYFSFSAGTIGFDSSTSTGFYFEVTQLTYGDSSSIGLHDTAYPVAGLDYGSWIGSSGNPNGISYVTSGTVYNFGSTISSQGTYTSNGDVIGVAVKDNKIWFSKNGTYISGNPSTGTSPTATLSSAKVLTPIINGFTSGVYALNAGQRAFNTAAPTGFKALCTSNLPTPTIADGSAYFESKLYTGNGSTNALTMSNSSMSPDWVYIHARSTTGDHEMFDVIRGANQVLESNSTNASSNVSNTLTSFDSNGFTLGSSSLVNDNNVTYVAYAWDGGSSNATNTSGSVNSTVRANIAAGFSIVKWTGTGSAETVGHGLGVKPHFIISHKISGSGQWPTYNAEIGATKYMYFNSTIEARTYQHFWNNTEPTSSVFSIGTDTDVSHSGNTHIAYCFAPVAGYSAMGKYDGTGSSPGAFVYTGFKPALVMIKRITVGESWVFYDTSRDTFNPTVTRAWSDLNLGDSVNTGHFIDILSNGFKVRSGGGLLGASGSEYFYWAIAENPFQANGGLAR